MTLRPISESTVLFRCDATERGGVGHLVRCAALAQALRAGGCDDIHLSGDISAPLGRAILSDGSITVHPAEKGSRELLDLARRIGAAVVHVDCYGGYEDLRIRGSSVGVLTSNATDERFGRRDADVIVDGSLTSLRVFDPLYGGAAVALGPTHLALRAGITSDAPDRTAEEKLAVLIVMGGTDAADYGPRIAEVVAGLAGVDRVGVVGADDTSFAADAARAEIVGVARKPEFADVVAGWDVAVTAAGTTVWELAALGVPMAVLGVAENQRDHYQSLISEGLAAGLGFLPDPAAIDTGELAALLGDSARRRRMIRDARALVDGRGASRIVLLWNQVLVDRSQRDLVARAASDADAGRLFAWRNDPSTRRASRSTEPVAWNAHLRWLGKAIASRDRRLYVGLLGGEPMGTVRFDSRGQREWEISVTIAPAARGRGLAAALVAAATKELVNGGLHPARLVAELRTTKIASRAVFASAGYRFRRAAGEWEQWEFDPVIPTGDPN